MMDETFREGNFPPLFLLSCVRSAGGAFSALAAGPAPLPSVPCQTAQYDVFISLPVAGDVSLTVTCWIVVFGWSFVWSCAATMQVKAIKAGNTEINLFIDIDFLLLLILSPPKFLVRRFSDCGDQRHNRLYLVPHRRNTSRGVPKTECSFL